MVCNHYYILMLGTIHFNPHQFNFVDFFVDYRDYVRWLTRGNSSLKELSWTHYTKIRRARLTGEKFDGGYVLGRNTATFNLLLGR